MEELYKYKTLVSLKITLAHFPRILTIISTRPGKKLVCYFLPVLIVGKSILLFRLSSGGNPACPCCCMVLSFYAYSYFTIKTGALPVLVFQKYFLHSQVCTWASTSSVVVSELS